VTTLLVFEDVDEPFFKPRQDNTNEGRAELVRSGKWTQEKADHTAKLQHRKGSKTRSGPFIAWDGEGVTENGVHKYIMLCNSNGEIARAKKGRTLSTMDCLNMLCNTAYMNPKANHVVYGGSYDANMMLGDLSLYECQQLAQDGFTHWGPFRIEYRPRKFLMVTRYHADQMNGRHFKDNKDVTITLWDVIGFFQQSFVRTLVEWQIGKEEDNTFVEEMKYGRSDFTRKEQKEIERYCFIECAQLVEVMTKLRNQTRTLALTPARWDGAGALSTKLLQKYHVRDHMDRNIPAAVNRAAQFAYFGGRIECVQYGNYEHTCYAHDIVSAYPYAMTKLPCLAHGKWVHSTHRKNSTVPKHNFQLSRVEFEIHEAYDIHVGLPLMPFPSRGPHSEVYFPPQVNGWYWKPEVDNALEYLPDSVKVLETWSFIPECDHQPFGYIPEVFEHRRKLKEKKNLAQIILKLALNGTYGKLCQAVGWDKETGEPPRFHQLEWAGYITSFTRAQIYRLAMINPGAVISFETDGLFATVPLVTEEVNVGELGSWEIKEYTGITYVTSGVYWVNDTKPGLKTQHWAPKYRGFDPPKTTPDGKVVEGLARQFILDAWRDHVARIGSTSTRFRGLNISSQSPTQFVEWRQWVTENRELRVFPLGKRAPVIYKSPRSPRRDPANGLVRTFAMWGWRDSAPHPLPWIDGVTKTMADVHYREQMNDEENEEDF
jgi:hypothetical protein